MYLKITEEGKAQPINFSNDLDPSLAIKKIEKIEPGCKVVEYKKDLPPEGLPVEGWIWDAENEEITIDATLFPINWAGILADLVGLDTRIKMVLGFEYLIMYQAALEANQAYMAQELVTVNQKLSQADWALLVPIFELHFFPIGNLELDEAPF